MFMIQGFIQIVLEKLLQISLSSLSQVRNSPFQLGKWEETILLDSAGPTSKFTWNLYSNITSLFIHVSILLRWPKKGESLDGVETRTCLSLGEIVEPSVSVNIDWDTFVSFIYALRYT